MREKVLTLQVPSGGIRLPSGVLVPAGRYDGLAKSRPGLDPALDGDGLPSIEIVLDADYLRERGDLIADDVTTKAYDVTSLVETGTIQLV